MDQGDSSGGKMLLANTPDWCGRIVFVNHVLNKLWLARQEV